MIFHAPSRKNSFPEVRRAARRCRRGVVHGLRPARKKSFAPRRGGRMMKGTAFGFVIALACVLIGWELAEAQQLAKRGTYTSTFAWNGVTKVYEGDKDHMAVAGEYTGVNLTDGGQPFLHHAAVVCPAVAFVDKGIATNRGHCITTDRDGDKAFLVWQCRSPQPGARCEGDFQWTGGTGKYTGLSGKNCFNAGVIPTTTAGYSIWKGEWQLPE